MNIKKTAIIALIFVFMLNAFVLGVFLTLNYNKIVFGSIDESPQFIFEDVPEKEQKLIQENIIDIIKPEFLVGIDVIKFINKESIEIPFDDSEYLGLYTSAAGRISIKVSVWHDFPLDSDSNINNYLFNIRETTCHELWHHWINPDELLVSDAKNREHAVMHNIDLITSCFTRGRLH